MLRDGGGGVGCCWRTCICSRSSRCYVIDGVGRGGVDAILVVADALDATSWMGWVGVGWGSVGVTCSCGRS